MSLCNCNGCYARPLTARQDSAWMDWYDRFLQSKRGHYVPHSRIVEVYKNWRLGYDETLGKSSYEVPTSNP